MCQPLHVMLRMFSNLVKKVWLTKNIQARDCGPGLNFTAATAVLHSGFPRNSREPDCFSSQGAFRLQIINACSERVWSIAHTFLVLENLQILQMLIGVDVPYSLCQQAMRDIRFHKIPCLNALISWTMNALIVTKLMHSGKAHNPMSHMVC